MPEDKELIKHFFDTLKLNFDRCFYPLSQCSQTAIKAHSVQNNGVLDSLSVKNHVIMIATKATSHQSPPELYFDFVSRHKATTFTGLCNPHDSEIFRPIDVNPINLNDPEHLFLLSYRSLLREFHTQCLSVQKMQTTYSKLVEKGLDSGNEDSFAMREATGQIITSYETYKYKCVYDLIYAKRTFKEIDYTVLNLGNSSPCIAASAVFRCKLMSKEANLLPYISVNVFPQNGSNWLVFASLREHSNSVQGEIIDIQNSNDYYRRYLVSKMILCNIENFVIHPDHYTGFSEQKRISILDYFRKTMFDRDCISDSEDYYLF